MTAKAILKLGPSLFLALLAGACSDGNNNNNKSTEPEPVEPTVSCAEVIPDAVQACISEINTAAGDCYFDGGRACSGDDPGFVNALNTLGEEVAGACQDGDFMGMTTEATVGRLTNACQSQSDALSWRTFGGPQGAVWPKADNGGIGVRTLGDIKIPQWGVTEYLPPYCFTGECAVGPELYKAISPRLKQVPEQQMLILSNQKDRTQQGDAFFTDEAQWINAMRQAYCDTKDLNGIQWYLTSDSVNSVHVVSPRDEFYYGEVAGERMVDWFSRAVNDPDSVSDFAEEGNFVNDIPGSLPFPCDLP